MPPEIDSEKCIGCGKCVNVCSEDVFFGTKGFGKVVGEKPVVSYPEVCWHCSLCVKECPVEGAIWLRLPLAMSVAYRRAALGQKEA
ncbi:MAG: ferredoxin family protein [Chloroflexi bacterium]|nr:ferredoxin family protein [Chloroflexota bacterium]